ncbi:MAG: ABC transporter permease [Desulfovibrio sp.]
MQLVMAWRNIWRNPKRTLIILTAVIIGAWSMVFFGALSRGMMQSMLDNSLRTLTGHIQIQQKDYSDDPVVENRIENVAPVIELLENELPEGAKWGLRLAVNGVASNAHDAKSVTIVGIDPAREPELSFYGDHLEAGRLLKDGEMNGILVGKELLDMFETKLKRKIVLMTQGADGETQSRAFKIRGVYRAELSDTEKRYVFITLSAARALLGIEGGATAACIQLAEREDVEGVVQKLQVLLEEKQGGKTVDVGLTVRPWQEMLPILTGYLTMFDSFMLLWYLVVFVAMGFGIVNTTLMAVLERIREYGLLKALGMKPAGIIKSVLTECCILLLLGIFAGDLLGGLTVVSLSGGIDLSFMAQGAEYLGMSHLIIPVLQLGDLLTVNGIIFILGMAVCLYPALKAGKITPVQAMSHQ